MMYVNNTNMVRHILGDVNEKTGRIFWRYRKDKEEWLTPEKFFQRKANHKASAHRWEKANRDGRNAYHLNYFKDRIKVDPYFKLKCNLRTRVKLAMSNGGRTNSSESLLGASFEVVHNHITQLLKPGMTWENYGRDTWHIDHIVPLAAFDLTKEAEQKKAFHYTNLQPLWAEDNYSKSSIYNGKRYRYK